MLKKLMRMEERIVLDGAVAAAVADNAANGADSANPGSNDNTQTPILNEEQDTGNNSTFNDADNDATQPDQDGIGSDSNPDSDHTGHLNTALEEAIENINSNNEEPLKALIVNSEISESADLIAAAADDVIVITYDNDTTDMQSILEQLDAIAGDREYESIALATHSGNGGEIALTGNETVTTDSLTSDTQQAAFFAGLGELLSDNGRIDLMSCYSGLGEGGDSLISTIENISGKAVAASTDTTGNETYGGDWILEKGGVDVSAIYFNESELADYSCTLQLPASQITTSISGFTDTSVTDFGAHIAVDGNIMIVTSNELTNYTNCSLDDEGLHMFYYTDTDADSIADSWVYQNSFYLSTTGASDIGTVTDIYDLEICGDSFAVSVNGDDSTGKDAIIYFTDITNASANSTESFYHTASNSTDIIGTDIELIKDLSNGKNILFWTEQRDTVDGSGNPGNDGTLDHSRVAYIFTTSPTTEAYLDYNTTASIDMKIAADHVNNKNSLAITGTNDSQILVWDDITTNTITTLTNSRTVTNIDMRDDTIIASIPSYNSNLGAVSVYCKGSNEAWDSDAIDLKITLTGPMSFIGVNDIEISDTGNFVLATAGTDSTSRVYAWDISEAKAGSASSITLTTPQSFEVSSTVNSIALAENYSLILAGSSTFNSNKGVVDSFIVSSAVTPAADPDSSSDSDIVQVLAGGFTNVFNTTNYLENFGAHVANDDGLAVVTTENIYDGIMLYSYTVDANSDGTYDGWEYRTTFYIDPTTITSYLNNITPGANIFDLEIEGDTFIISIDDDDHNNAVLVYENISDYSRSDGLHESEILFDSSSGTTFGEDIAIVEGAIYATSRYSSCNSKICYYWENSGYYGDSKDSNPTNKYRTISDSYTFYTGAAPQLTIAADKRTSSGAGDDNIYTLAVTGIDNSESYDNYITVWTSAFGSDTTTNNATNLEAKTSLTFTPSQHGGLSSDPAVITSLTVEEGIILAGISGYRTASQATNDAPVGAVVAFRGVNGDWSVDGNDLTSDSNASVYCVYVGNPDSGYTGSIGENVAFSDNGEFIASTTSGVDGNAVLVWHNNTNLQPSELTYFVSPQALLTGIDASEAITNIDIRNNGQVFAGSPASAKDIENVTNTGVVNILNGNQPLPDDINVTELYYPGIADGSPSTTDFGSITFYMSETVEITEYGANMSILILNEGGTYTGISINSNEAATILATGGNTKFSINLNDPKYNSLQIGNTYTLLIPPGMMGDSTGGIDSEGTTLEFTLSEVTPEPISSSSSYILGSSSSDKGDLTISFAETVNISQKNNYSNQLQGITLYFYDFSTNQEIQVSLTYNETINMFNSSRTQLTLDLNNEKFNFLNNNTKYSFSIPAETFTDNSGTPDTTDTIYEFTVSNSSQSDSDNNSTNNDNIPDTSIITDNSERNDNTPTTELPSLADLSDLLENGLGDGLSNLLGLDGEGSNQNNPLTTPDSLGMGLDFGDITENTDNAFDDISDDANTETPVEEGEQAEDEENSDETENENEGEVAEGEENGEKAGEGEKQAEAETNGENENDNNQNQNSNLTSNQLSSPTGPTQNMMLQNPYAENLSMQETQKLFNSSLQAFSGLANAGETTFGLAQNAIGDTLTTAALVNNSEQLLTNARELLAMIGTDSFNEMEYSVSGSGYTAATESVSMIVEDAIASMVEARGNALVANDLLRILSINIKGFDDRLAENSFSAGVKRLAASNQELAYSYEVLNSILKAIQTSKDNGEILSASELKEMLPNITEQATEISLSISEKGDRASKDVLTFLTKRLEQNGIDKENLQAQVDTIFKEWHNNLGLSAPVSADQPFNVDLVQAM